MLLSSLMPSFLLNSCNKTTSLAILLVNLACLWWSASLELWMRETLVRNYQKLTIQKMILFEGFHANYNKRLASPFEFEIIYHNDP